MACASAKMWRQVSACLERAPLFLVYDLVWSENMHCWNPFNSMFVIILQKIKMLTIAIEPEFISHCVYNRNVLWILNWKLPKRTYTHSQKRLLACKQWGLMNAHVYIPKPLFGQYFWHGISVSSCNLVFSSFEPRAAWLFSFDRMLNSMLRYIRYLLLQLKIVLLLLNCEINKPRMWNYSQCSTFSHFPKTGGRIRNQQVHGARKFVSFISGLYKHVHVNGLFWRNAWHAYTGLVYVA